MIGVGTLKISAKARQYVNEVLISERLSYGPFMKKFERLFAGAHDCRFAIMTNSGTSSLQIALAALKSRHGWKDGDEVIVPAVTFIATSNIVIQNNMTPIFVDIEPTYYEIDPAKIEAAITPRTRCIIPVHLFGSPCDMDPILDVAKRHNLRIIEDSCETMFAKYKGRSVGSFGDIGCFSTYIAHILTTGVGGLCTTNDGDLAIQLRSLLNHGRDSIYLNIDDDNNKTKDELEMIVKRRFSFVQMGYSYRATEMEGALGVAEFEDREDMMQRRWDNAHELIQRLKPLESHLQLPQVRPDSGHAFMMFPIVLRNEKKTNFVNYLEENGIETRDMLPLINQPYYKQIFNIREADYPVSKWVNENGFYIGCHQNLTDIEKDFIVQKFFEYYEHKTVKNESFALICLSKGDGHAAELVLANLPLDSFEEKILIESAGDTEISKAFRKQKFHVIAEKKGKGEALQAAVNYATCENIIVIGLDGADDPLDISKIMIGLRKGNGLVIASRFAPGGSRETDRALSYRSIGNRFFSFMLSIIFSNNITDSNNLFRGFKKSVWSKLQLKQTGDSIMFEQTLQVLENKIPFSEFPTHERKSLSKRRRRNRFLSALEFLFILAKYLFNPRTQGKRRRL